MTDERLTAGQVQAAIITLAGWSAHSFTDEDRAAWRYVLQTTYRSGELAKCLDAWQRTDKGSLRPKPADLAPFLERPEIRPRHAAYDSDPTLTDAERTSSLAEMQRVCQLHEELIPSRRGRLKVSTPPPSSVTTFPPSERCPASPEPTPPVQGHPDGGVESHA